MFEDSLVKSRLVPISSSKRWTTLASIGVQFAVAATIIALPLLHPEALPFHMESPKIMLPPPPKLPAPVVRLEHASTTSTGVAMPSTAPTMLLPSLLPNRNIPANDPPPATSIGNGMNNDSGLLSIINTGGTGHSTSVSVASPRAPIGPIRVSSGISQGMLIAPIRPIYPTIAKTAHIEGSVVVEAIISRIGTIESLHVLSGPAMLQSAAVDAIREARYKPYKLNGEPTEVQTTITVNFKIGE
jgi:protein TonB